MQNVMLDLETLGTQPGCVVLSIGAVGFDETGLSTERFYQVISIADSARLGLAREPDTVAWWVRQSPDARQVLVDAAGSTSEIGATTTCLPVADALHAFTEFLSQFGGSQVRLWGNGPDFDNAILATVYRTARIEVPWKFYHNRCLRTLRGLCPSVMSPPRLGVNHNALDDAVTQATHASEILRHLFVIQNGCDRVVGREQSTPQHVSSVHDEQKKRPAKPTSRRTCSGR